MDTKLAPRELPGDTYKWYVEVLLAINCFVNALLGGWHHEALSSRSWRAWENDKFFGTMFRPLVDALFIWQTGRMDHCEVYHKSEVKRTELIVRARK